ncbi:MAG: 50S ribosomal protein L15 [Planctomycetota bacterium]|nr:MAG: 50S ribosomal protein L15 [Planctomycetota bacterium]
MMIHEITAQVGRHRQRKRVGRGRASGHGKTSGRGHKGAQSRSGNSTRPQFEGGSLPYFRRIPVRGFSNVKFRTRFWTVNLGDVLAHPSFAKGGAVTKDALIDAGLIRDHSRPLKILGDLKNHAGQEIAEVSVALEVAAERVTKSARAKIEAAGGSVTETGTRRDRVRGIDRASGDPTPKNLTKKLKRSKPRVAADAGGKKKKKKK